MYGKIYLETTVRYFCLQQAMWETQAGKKHVENVIYHSN